MNLLRDIQDRSGVAYLFIAHMEPTPREQGPDHAVECHLYTT